MKKLIKIKPKKERIRKEKPIKEKIGFKKASFSLKSNKFFYFGAFVYSIALFIVSYLVFGILIAGLLLLPFLFLVFLSMIMDRHVKKAGVRKLVKLILIVIAIVGIVGIMLFAAFFIYIAMTAPKFDSKKLDTSETTIIYDNKNQIVTTIGLERREKITYNDLSQVLIDAIIATEDSRFFQHNGLDAPRFAKAAIGQVLGRDSGGGSTLTMQVAKNNFTSTEASGVKGIIRKFTDIYLSIFKLEKNYTKEEIIEFYVNGPFLGSKSYGVEQASLTYFGKSAKNLNLAEASLIAGLFQAPGAYDPNISPEKAEARRSTVLSLMKRHGYITAEEEEIAKSISVKSLLIDYKVESSPYQGYIDVAVNEVIAKTGLDPYSVPMLIYTNMDTKKQDTINKIYTDSKTYKWRNSTIQAGIAAVDVDTGKIVVIGAGRNRNGERTFNYATDINRQIGSTAKPLFDYGPGIEFNNWSTGKVFDDSKYTYSDGGSLNNWDGKFDGIMTLRRALQRSRNIPALKAFQQVDNLKIASFVQSLGIKPELDSEGRLHEAHSIGGFNGSNPLTMAAAYATFSNGGYYYEPYAVNKIVLRNDKKETLTYSSTGERVMSEATAYMITNILYTGVGNGINVKRISGVPLAAKTGTTDYDRATRKAWNLPMAAVNDGWIAGFSPSTAMVIWYGYNNIQKGVYLTMSQNSLDKRNIYYIAGKAVFDKESAWKKPSSVSSVKIEKNSDPEALPSTYTPSDQIVTELFKKGTEPTEISNKYVPLPTPENLNVTYAVSSSTISWDAVTPHEGLNLDTFGAFGYEVYYNGAYVGFTTLTSYNYDTTYPYGVYTVKSAYQKIKTNRSEGATYTLVKDASSINLSVQINGNASDKLTLGSTYTEPAKPVTAYDNLIDVTNACSITKSIYSHDGLFIGSSISDLNSYNNTPGTYKITYKITYSGVSKTKDKLVIFE